MAPSDIWERIVQPSGAVISATEVQQFEAELGFSLPEDYRNFMLTLNGGKVLVDHDIPVEGLFGAAFVHYLYPFSKPSPFLGIKEARRQQECSRLCLRQAIEIGVDTRGIEVQLGLYRRDSEIPARLEAGSYRLSHHNRASVRVIKL